MAANPRVKGWQFSFLNHLFSFLQGTQAKARWSQGGGRWRREEGGGGGICWRVLQRLQRGRRRQQLRGRRDGRCLGGGAQWLYVTWKNEGTQSQEEDNKKKISPSRPYKWYLKNPIFLLWNRCVLRMYEPWVCAVIKMNVLYRNDLLQCK